MKLKDFITQALTDIVDGVEAANLLRPESVNPTINGELVRFSPGNSVDGMWNVAGAMAQLVEFEIQVEVETDVGAAGSAGWLEVFSVKAGVKQDTVRTNRIFFKVPMVLGKRRLES